LTKAALKKKGRRRRRIFSPANWTVSLFDGENISFEVRIVMYINSTNVPPIMIMNRIYENQNLLYIFPLIVHIVVVCINLLAPELFF